MRITKTTVKELIKPQNKTNRNKVQAYTTEGGNPGCTKCNSGCYNCGCRKDCGD